MTIFFPINERDRLNSRRIRTPRREDEGDGEMIVAGQPDEQAAAITHHHWRKPWPILHP
jgi:hypothetical protein